MRQKSTKPERLAAIDLFAGGGGLTVGLKRAGFRVVSAVEIEPHAFATYKTNHTDVTAYRQDIRTVDGTVLARSAPAGSVDLLAGCPPCQGFSSLTSKYRCADPRNTLVREMGRIVKEANPLAVMMENVPGLAQKGKPLLDELVALLEKQGYTVTQGTLQVADFGIPQNRRRFVLLAGKGFKIELPKATHSWNGKNGLQKWTSIDVVLKGLKKPITLDKAKERGGPKTVNWHVVRCLSPDNMRRIKKAKPGNAWWSGIPKRMRPECHQSKDAGFSNVYGRMKWGSVSPTITGGCTTFSKGRFGHPTQNRTISVYEAALLQTFPVDYVFDTPFMDHACNIIGNALPCDFAQVVAQQCADAIHDFKAKQEAALTNKKKSERRKR
jgi:DNA (cytosine-5)-methyltransferase 1